MAKTTVGLVLSILNVKPLLRLSVWVLIETVAEISSKDCVEVTVHKYDQVVELTLAIDVCKRSIPPFTSLMDLKLMVGVVGTLPEKTAVMETTSFCVRILSTPECEKLNRLTSGKTGFKAKVNVLTLVDSLPKALVPEALMLMVVEVVSGTVQ